MSFTNHLWNSKSGQGGSRLPNPGIPLRKLQIISERNKEILSTLHRNDVKTNIPVIVAIGDESSGKSSMLEQIAQQRILAKGTGTVTRCPIELRLKQAGKEGTKFAVDGQEFGSAREVESCLEVIGEGIKANCKGGFSDVAIRVTIESNDTPVVTLVDLPGLIAVSADKNDLKSPHKIANMVSHHISNEMATILVVVEGNRSFKTNPCVRMAHDVDPNGHRTIVVVTKLDLIASDPRQIANFAEALKEGKEYFPLGVIGVCCRTENETFEEAREKERAAIQTIFSAPEMQQFNPNEHGIEVLGNKLSDISLKQIQGAMEGIVRDLEKQKRALEAELDSLGPGDASDKRKTLRICLDRFSDDFENELLGTYDRINFWSKCAGVLVEGNLRNHLSKTLKGIRALEGLQDDKIVNAIINSRAGNGKIRLVEPGSESVVADQIRQMEKPCLEIVTSVLEIMKDKLPNNCFPFTDQGKQGSYPPLQDRIRMEVHKLLARPYENVKEKIIDYIAIQAEVPKTADPSYQKLWEERKNLGWLSEEECNLLEAMLENGGTLRLSSEGSSGKKDKENGKDKDKDGSFKAVREKLDFARALVECHFEIVNKKTQDDVPKIVYKHLVKHAAVNIRQAMNMVYHDAVAGNCENTLICENEEIVKKRGDAQRKLLLINQALGSLMDLDSEEFVRVNRNDLN